MMNSQVSLPIQNYAFELEKYALSLLLRENEEMKTNFFHKQCGKSYDLNINQESMTQSAILLQFFDSPSPLRNYIEPINESEQSQQQPQQQLQVQKDRLNQHKQEYLRQIATLKAQIEGTFMKIVQPRQETLRNTIQLQKDILNHQKQAHLAIVPQQIPNTNSIIQILNEESQKHPYANNSSTILTQHLLKMENNRNFSCQKIQNNIKLKYLKKSCQNGLLWPVGLQVGSITKLSLKQTITDVIYLQLSLNLNFESIVAANLINSKITWEMNGSLLPSAEISQAIRANKLDFIIVMYYQNDEVEIDGN